MSIIIDNACDYAIVMSERENTRNVERLLKNQSAYISENLPVGFTKDVITKIITDVFTPLFEKHKNLFVTVYPGFWHPVRIKQYPTTELFYVTTSRLPLNLDLNKPVSVLAEQLITTLYEYYDTLLSPDTLAVYVYMPIGGVMRILDSHAVSISTRCRRMPNLKTINLNDEPMQMLGETLTYDDIRAAMTKRNYREGLLSIMYHNKDTGDHGLLFKGKSIPLRDGMRVSAIITDNA